ncbi:MAG TPA: helix-turn-helix transcriptional regulator [Candidatus Tumulicola sp.]
MAGGSDRRRDLVKARIGAALSLAIDNSGTEALNALDEIADGFDTGDDEIVARFHQAGAIAEIKARNVAAGFAAFDSSIAAARRHGEPLMLAKILNNYSTAAIQDGSSGDAVRYAREALQLFRGESSGVPIGLVTLSEALYDAAQLEECGDVLREFYSIQRSDATTEQAVTHDELLEIAAVSVPVGLFLSDAELLGESSPMLVNLAFSRVADRFLGPIAEAFCALYELQNDRAKHDELVLRAATSIRTLDQSLPFAVRVARTGPPELLPRFASLVAQQCGAGSKLMGAFSDLFQTAASMRRNVPKAAQEAGPRAAAAFAATGRPLLQAAAEEAFGQVERAREIRRGCGARTDAAHQRWWGERVKKNLGTALSAREMEVARLVAKGETYKEIAQVLDLSERTVHRHCESIFGKLGIRSRWQVAAALAPDAAPIG